MGYEDFTAYTEVDPESKITVTSTKVDWAELSRNATAYVYKDYNVGHFGDFEHLIEVQFNTTLDHSNIGCWVLTNEITDVAGIYTGAKTALVFAMSKESGVYQLYIADGNTWATDVYTCSANTLYYCKAKRDSTTYTVKIYSDSARSILLDTLTVACTSTTLRYLYAVSSWNSGHGAWYGNGFSQNFDLQEDVSVGASVYFYDGTNNIEIQRDDTSPVQKFNGVEIVGLKLGTTTDPNASPIHVFDGTTIKAILKMP